MGIGSTLGFLIILSSIYLLKKYTDRSTIKGVFWPAISFKLIASLLLSSLYLYYYGEGDMLSYFSDAQLLRKWALNEPSSFIHFLFSDSLGTFELSDSLLFGPEKPRAFFFVKICSLIAIISGGQFILMSIILALISFAPALIFANNLSNYNRELHLPTIFSLLFMPEVVFWSSGLLKESLAVAGLIIILNICFLILYHKQRAWKRLYLLLGALFSLFILWKLKYYYFALLVPTIFSLILSIYLVRKYQISQLSRLGVFLGLLTLLIGLSTLFKEQLGLYKLPQLIFENYTLYVAHSNPGDYVSLSTMDGSWKSLLLNTPYALFSGLFRPSVFDVNSYLDIFPSLINLLILILFIAQLKPMAVQIKNVNLIVISALFYSFSLCTLLVMSAPNYGTLSRYRVGWLLVFSFLILYRNPLIEKVTALAVFNRKEKNGQTSNDLR